MSESCLRPPLLSPCVRLLAAMACELGLGLSHFDVEQAFVQSPLDENMYRELTS